jgi:hypothetical protein
MADLTGTSLQGWHLGFHPDAAGLQVRSLERVEVPLGEALRLEMTTGDTGPADTVHVQYYIVTPAGPWALWSSSPRADLAAGEAALAELVPSFGEEP